MVSPFPYPRVVFLLSHPAENGGCTRFMMVKKFHSVGEKHKTEALCHTLPFFMSLYTALPDGQEFRWRRMPSSNQVLTPQ
jgi:hypothetical protein